MADGPIPFKKSGTGGKFNVESQEAGKSSFSVSPSPQASRKPLRSATNPDGVGVSKPDRGHTCG